MSRGLRRAGYKGVCCTIYGASFTTGIERCGTLSCGVGYRGAAWNSGLVVQ